MEAGDAERGVVDAVTHSCTQALVRETGNPQGGILASAYPSPSPKTSSRDRPMSQATYVRPRRGDVRLIEHAPWINSSRHSLGHHPVKGNYHPEYHFHVMCRLPSGVAVATHGIEGCGVGVPFVTPASCLCAELWREHG